MTRPLRRGLFSVIGLVAGWVCWLLSQVLASARAGCASMRRHHFTTGAAP